jgi:hypothetical protein
MKSRPHSCTYVIALDDNDGRLRDLARYLSTLSFSGCEVVILDTGSPASFEERQRVLRWVGRHIAVDGQPLLHAAAEFASCEKVIMASASSRFMPAELMTICDLLERHELVQPEEYIAPLTWWGAIDAGRALLHRGVDQPRAERRTFGIRRCAVRAMRGMEERQVLQAAHAYEARSLFVRREPGSLAGWLAMRAREAASDLVAPMRSVFFLAFLPLLVALAAIGGLPLAGSCAVIVGFVSVAVAVRGRMGAGEFFPMHACLFAPLWIAERSITIYWAAADRLRGAAAHPVRSQDASAHRTAPSSISVRSSGD